MFTGWEFYKQQPTDPIHNPISAEFFSTEAVSDVAEAIIREGVQNSLDARIRKSDGSRERAEVRIYLSDRSGALNPLRCKRWFGSLWPHVIAPKNGLRDLPSEKDPCPFLVFEDFGTTGLTGDPSAYQVKEGQSNHFLNFFRAEGQSDKSGSDAGSWGIGKTVFPRASRISTFVGLTITAEKVPLLLGRSILRYHRVGSQAYKSDGYLGVRREDDFMVPISDKSAIREFVEDFAIVRQDEPGLSIVVPWYEMGNNDGITWERLVRSVLRTFFYPILTGHLAVTISKINQEMRLDSNSIIRKVELLDDSDAKGLLPIIQLAQWAQKEIQNEFKSLSAPKKDKAQSWAPELIPPQLAGEIRQSIKEGKRLALRVPIAIHPYSKSPQSTFFSVFLEKSETNKDRPLFIRDELIISDVKSPRIPNIRSLVIVDDQPLASLLRDAETPAHTQWNQATSNFKNKYKYGTSVINFVRLSVSEIVHIINEAEQEPDPSITIDFFWLKAQPEDIEALPVHRKEPKLNEGEGPSPSEVPIPLGQLKRFRIETLQGGFAIRNGDSAAVRPKIIDIRVAYDVRRGNPFKKHSPIDFKIGEPPIRYDRNTMGVKVQNVGANEMRIFVEEPTFNFEVTGFDPNRDLCIRATVRENENDQAN